MSAINYIDINGTLFKLKAGANVTFNDIYPIGSIYLTTRQTDPANLFGGSWQRLQSTFLLAAGDTYAAGSTGGAASHSYTPAGSVNNHTLTTAQLPSHTHTLNATTSTSKAPSGGHGHTFTDARATTTGSTAVSTAQITSHSHPYYGSQKNVWLNTETLRRITVATNEGAARTVSNTLGGRNYSQNAGSTNGHTHSGQNTSTSRTSNGISANHTHTATLTGTIGNAGSGGAHNHTFTGTEATIDTMPPYTTVYGWLRTA